MSFRLIEKWMPELMITLAKQDFIRPEDLERELGKASLLYGRVDSCQPWFNVKSEVGYLPGTHQGLIIGIQPIELELSVVDEASEIIKNFIEQNDFAPHKWAGIAENNERARKFLERSKK